MSRVTARKVRSPEASTRSQPEALLAPGEEEQPALAVWLRPLVVFEDVLSSSSSSPVLVEEVFFALVVGLLVAAPFCVEATGPDESSWPADFAAVRMKSSFDATPA